MGEMADWEIEQGEMFEAGLDPDFPGGSSDIDFLMEEDRVEGLAKVKKVCWLKSGKGKVHLVELIQGGLVYQHDGYVTVCGQEFEGRLANYSSQIPFRGELCKSCFGKGQE